jgi:ATP-dependent DNA ligase
VFVEPSLVLLRTMTSPRPQARCSVEAGHHAVEQPNNRERSLRSYAFDILVSDGEDLRRLPLSMRKASLARLLARRVDGIHLAPFEQGEIGPDLFRHACLMGLEGLVCKHCESTYRGARFNRWVKVKNRALPGVCPRAGSVRLSRLRLGRPAEKHLDSRLHQTDNDRLSDGDCHG